jgi:multidrug resistance efflux pump
MTLAGRLKLFLGLVVVLVVAALATYHLNESRGHVVAHSAQIQARTYQVGTPYAGLVTDQKVEVGDHVKAGEPLFTIDSATLTYDMKTQQIRTTTEGTKVDDQGHLVVMASADGTVTKVGGQRGTFVQGSSDLATVERAGTLYVQAEFTLSPKDYARIEPHARVDVTLPNHHTLVGHVADMSVKTAGGKAEALVKVDVPGLKDGTQGGVVSSGAPVEATIALRNDGPVTQASHKVRDYVHRTVADRLP